MGGYGMKTVPVRLDRHVRFQGDERKHLLALSVSQFDPQETFQAI
jgi:hypothetical protein